MCLNYETIVTFVANKAFFTYQVPRELRLPKLTFPSLNNETKSSKKSNPLLFFL